MITYQRLHAPVISEFNPTEAGSSPRYEYERLLREQVASPTRPRPGKTEDSLGTRVGWPRLGEITLCSLARVRAFPARPGHERASQPGLSVDRPRFIAGVFPLGNLGLHLGVGGPCCRRAHLSLVIHSGVQTTRCPGPPSVKLLDLKPLSTVIF